MECEIVIILVFILLYLPAFEHFIRYINDCFFLALLVFFARIYIYIYILPYPRRVEFSTVEVIVLPLAPMQVSSYLN